MGASDRPPGAAGHSSRGHKPALPALAARLMAIAASLASAVSHGGARRRGAIWRAEVAEDSMRPALLPGDWLLLDPTPAAWPRRGSIVVVREPETGILAVKRVAARPGDHVTIPEGYLHLAPDEAWLLGDNAAHSIDSRRYGPVELGALVARVWFRYWPPRRIGPVRRRG